MEEQASKQTNRETNQLRSDKVAEPRIYHVHREQAISGVQLIAAGSKKRDVKGRGGSYFAHPVFAVNL